MKNKSFGRVKVKNMVPKKKRLSGHMPLEEIPKDCGYDKKFEFDVNMHSNGIMGECIEWCQLHCKKKWGWWFRSGALYDPMLHNWEDQDAFMSFECQKEAMAFWLAVGLVNTGNIDR